LIFVKGGGSFEIFGIFSFLKNQLGPRIFNFKTFKEPPSLEVCFHFCKTSTVLIYEVGARGSLVKVGILCDLSTKTWLGICWVHVMVL
jgi:hypothetical protein